MNTFPSFHDRRRYRPPPTPPRRHSASRIGWSRRAGAARRFPVRR
ncbi:hypothetical protein NSERUTF1_1536 [Nocardia seriolae]|nr:hypothetical protein NSERUTF1_1536 [Nocardia seriolae]